MSIGMLKGLHRRVFGISEDDEVMAVKGLAAGGTEGRAAIVFPTPDYAAIFDDFFETPLKGLGVGDTGGVPTVTDTGVVGNYLLRKSGDTGNAAVVNAGTNGFARITMSSSIATQTPASGSAFLVGPQLAWKANQGAGGQAGRLRFAARVRLGSTTQGTVFFGLTDNAGAEFPIYDTGGNTGPLSPAADAVGIHWGVRGDTGWVGVAAKSTAGDSGDQNVPLGVSPTAGKWTTLEIEVRRGISDTGGHATFYVDGVAKKSLSSPINTGVALTPAIAILDTGGNTLDIDWINISAPRDTGS